MADTMAITAMKCIKINDKLIPAIKDSVGKSFKSRGFLVISLRYSKEFPTSLLIEVV
jgi:hypothetical protein